MADDSTDHQLAAGLAPSLALLAAVRETGNITRAAELLGVPQPTVSRRIAAMGELFGAPLTRPDGRGIQLTRAGALLADAATRAMTTVDTAVRQAREEISPSTGLVALGFLHLLGRSLVPGLISGFRAEHPGVRFSLVQGSRQDILDRLARGTGPRARRAGADRGRRGGGRGRRAAALPHRSGAPPAREPP